MIIVKYSTTLAKRRNIQPDALHDRVCVRPRVRGVVFGMGWAWETWAWRPERRGRKKNRKRGERKGGRGQAGQQGRRKEEASSAKGRGQSSISTTLSQLTQLFLCSKFPLISLHYLLSANHFSSGQLFPLLF